MLSNGKENWKYFHITNAPQEVLQQKFFKLVDKFQKLDKYKYIPGENILSDVMSLGENILSDAVYKALLKACVEIPEDVKKGFQQALEAEKNIAKQHLKVFLENIEMAVKRMSIVCPDTGYPIFYIKVGDNVKIDGGLSVLKKIVEKVVEKASKEGYLRKTLIHPLSRVSCPNNIGQFIPYIEYKPVAGDFLEITMVPKGGGAELFAQSPYRSLLAADGIVGIKKFIVDTVIQASMDGKTCPPNIVGVGIGGFSDLCMKLAKQAATLRPIGDRHPDKEIARLEKELLGAINMTGIGPMGCGGKFTAFDVHVEFAHSHTAATPVAVNLNCALCRRATIRVYSNEEMEFRKSPDWFGREEK